MLIEQLLERVVKEGASDGFISADAAPSIKVDGVIGPISDHKLSDEEARELVLSTMREDQKEDFLKHHECNYAMSSEQFGRFRASAFVQRGKCGLVVRRIQSDIPTLDGLGLPPIIKDLAMTKRGLVIFVGATGTGRTATSPACGATGSGLIATSGAFAGCAAAQGEGGSCNQTGNAKACQDLLQVFYIHDFLLQVKGNISISPGAGIRQAVLPDAVWVLVSRSKIEI